MPPAAKIKKILLSICGIVAAFIVMEVILTLSAALMRNKLHPSCPAEAENDFALRILCAGDSFTFGTGAPPEKSYPRQLEQMINAAEPKIPATVFNLGRGGYNTTQVRRLLEENIASIRPDIVIILAGANNYFNHEGFIEHLRGRTVTAKLQDNLERLRTVKLVKILIVNLRRRLDGNLRQRDEVWELTVRLNEAGKAVPQAALPARGSDLQENPEFRRLLVPAENSAEESVRCFQLGLLYKENGEESAAWEWFQKGIEADPGNAGNYHELGWICQSRRQYEQAMAWFERGIEADPADSCNYISIGRLLMEKGEHSAAPEWLQKGIKINPAAANGYLFLGTAYKFLGDYETAEYWLKTGLKAVPETAAFYAEIGDIYFAHAEYRRALPWFKRACRLNPREPINYEYIGWIYFYEEKYEEARRWFNADGREDWMSGGAEEPPPVRPETSGRSAVSARADSRYSRGIPRWIETDIAAINAVCRQNNIPLIMQNYPSDFKTSFILEQITEKHEIIFVDQHKKFLELWKQGRRQSDYLIPDGHCTALGYEVMTRNILDVLLRKKIIGE